MEINVFRTDLLSGYMQTGGVPSSTLGTALVSVFVILGLGSCLLAPLARMASRIRGTSVPALMLARWSGILSGMGALSLGALSALRGESVLVTASCLVLGATATGDALLTRKASPASGAMPKAPLFTLAGMAIYLQGLTSGPSALVALLLALLACVAAHHAPRLGSLRAPEPAGRLSALDRTTFSLSVLGIVLATCGAIAALRYGVFMGRFTLMGCTIDLPRLALLALLPSITCAAERHTDAACARQEATRRAASAFGNDGEGSGLTPGGPDETAPCHTEASAGMHSLRSTYRAAHCLVALLMLFSKAYGALVVLLALVGLAEVFSSTETRKTVIRILVAGCVALALLSALDYMSLTSWLSAPTDPYGSGYDPSLVHKVMDETSVIGYGNVSATAMALPFGASTYALVRVLSAFGWAGVILALVCVACVVPPTLVVSPDKAAPGNLLPAGFAAYQLLCAASNTMYVFHLMPCYPLAFPLLSGDLASTLAMALAAVLTSWASNREHGLE